MKNSNNIKPLTSSELIQINGGTEWWEVALLVVSPGLGFFHFGVKHGYQDRAREMSN
ncbi:hypothetical protein LB456_06685 [Psychroflexus sp. CAK57W]|uniref:hypothetical protein n=1 Tax=Psychroflexus curvus TaxID=2873595 RepID=UPI001CCC4A9A|nr:hypothetical protein [Psychroflexus curvus]MBZ9787143.1 hypothetical protein [Psychroflexus curvus]